MQIPSRRLRHTSFQIQQATSCLNAIISWIWDNFTFHHDNMAVGLDVCTEEPNSRMLSEGLQWVAHAGLQEERKRCALRIWQGEGKPIESNLIRCVENTRASSAPIVHWTTREELTAWFQFKWFTDLRKGNASSLEYLSQIPTLYPDSSVIFQNCMHKMKLKIKVLKQSIKIISSDQKICLR